MALINPIYALLIPPLILITLPLAILATFTTTFAFSILLLRVLVVYLDMALSLLPQSLLPPLAVPYSPPSISASSPGPSGPVLTRHHRRRRSSVSVMSAGTVTPVSDRGLGLIPSVGAERDFEGVGGWRADDDDALWTAGSPRTERHHYRTASSTATTPGDGGYLMMKGRTRSPEITAAKRTSPNSSRARTPTGVRKMFCDGPGYLSASTSPKALKKMQDHNAE